MYTEFMAAKKYFWGIRTKISSSGKYYLLDDRVRDRRVRKVTGSNSVIVEEARSIEALPDHVGEDIEMFCWKWEQKSTLIV